MTHDQVVSTSRKWENVAFIGGVLIFLIHGLAETFIYVCTRLGKCSEGGSDVPWVQLSIALILIAPKMLGRSRAQAIILAVADLIRSRIQPGKP